jgi:SRSO17 transposase
MSWRMPPGSDEELLEQVRRYVLPTMQKQGPVVAWIVDDTGFPKKGTHSVGVARQYCGQVGKQENCRIGVSLSLSTANASLPIAGVFIYRKSGPKTSNGKRRAGIPEEIEFRTKPEIAFEQIRAAVDRQIPSAPVLADAAYGNDSKFREGISELGLLYVVGVQSFHHGLETRTSTDAQAQVERNRAPDLPVAPRSTPQTTRRNTCRVGSIVLTPSASNVRIHLRMSFAKLGGTCFRPNNPISVAFSNWFCSASAVSASNLHHTRALFSVSCRHVLIRSIRPRSCDSSCS